MQADQCLCFIESDTFSYGFANIFCHCTFISTQIVTLSLTAEVVILCMVDGCVRRNIAFVC